MCVYVLVCACTYMLVSACVYGWSKMSFKHVSLLEKVCTGSTNARDVIELTVFFCTFKLIW